MGDANLCTKKWKESGFVYKNIYQVLNTTLERNDVRINDVGTTYTSDHLQSNNTFTESSLDHVYNSNSINNKITECSFVYLLIMCIAV